MGDWKPADTPPDDARRVLVTVEGRFGYRTVERAYCCGRHWHYSGTGTVVAWAELPKPWGGGL